ncbi:MAG: DUF5666 domain-containing protein [Campylobacterales bacterium]|nr:DUF5666 domain-containing protein [Campylobacterales bacterium]
MNSISKKAIAVALVATIPLGLFAYDRHGDHDRDEYHKGSFFHDDYDDFDLPLSFLDDKGVNFGFEGKIEKMPTDGFNGIWKIGGRDVEVDNSTKIFIDERLQEQDRVEVYAKRDNGKLKAVLIEQD